MRLGVLFKLELIGTFLIWLSYYFLELKVNLTLLFSCSALPSLGMFIMLTSSCPLSKSLGLIAWLPWWALFPAIYKTRFWFLNDLEVFCNFACRWTMLEFRLWFRLVDLGCRSGVIAKDSFFLSLANIGVFMESRFVPLLITLEAFVTGVEWSLLARCK